MEQFKEYFNKTLKDALKYPERFEFVLTTGRITLNPNTDSKLLELIKNNLELKGQLLTQITSFLGRIYNTVGEVYFSSHGKDILINYTLKRPTELVQLDIGIYGIIASYLDTEDVYKLISSLNIKDLQAFYTSLLENKVGKLAKSFIGNQENYFKVWTYLESVIQIQSNFYGNLILIHDKLLQLYLEYPKEFTELVKYFDNIDHRIIIAIVQDIKVIKDIWDRRMDEKLSIDLYSQIMINSGPKIKLLEEHAEQMRNLFSPDYIEKNYIIYAKYIEKIEIPYLQNLIKMMEFYKI